MRRRRTGPVTELMQIIRNIAAVLDDLMWLVSAISFLIGFYLTGDL